MKSNESRKLLAMGHAVMALITFAVAIWQLYIVRDFAPDYTMNTGPIYVFFRVLMLSGLLWSVALVSCAVSLITEKRRTFCQFVSVVNLFLFPIGTILGGLTLYSLRNEERASVLLSSE